MFKNVSKLLSSNYFWIQRKLLTESPKTLSQLAFCGLSNRQFPSFWRNLEVSSLLLKKYTATLTSYMRGYVHSTHLYYVESGVDKERTTRNVLLEERKFVDFSCNKTLSVCSTLKICIFPQNTIVSHVFILIWEQIRHLSYVHDN